MTDANKSMLTADALGGTLVLLLLAALVALLASRPAATPQSAVITPLAVRWEVLPPPQSVDRLEFDPATGDDLAPELLRRP